MEPIQGEAGVIIEEGMIENAREIGAYFLDGLKQIKSPLIKQIRGKGLLIAVELVEDRHTKKPATQWKNNIILAAFEKGLLLLG